MIKDLVAVLENVVDNQPRLRYVIAHNVSISKESKQELQKCHDTCTKSLACIVLVRDKLAELDKIVRDFEEREVAPTLKSLRKE